MRPIWHILSVLCILAFSVLKFMNVSSMPNVSSSALRVSAGTLFGCLVLDSPHVRYLE